MHMSAANVNEVCAEVPATRDLHPHIPHGHLSHPVLDRGDTPSKWKAGVVKPLAMVWLIRILVEHSPHGPLV